MDSAERFYRQLDKMQGLYPQLTFRRTIQEVQRAFEEAMGHVPQTLVEAIFLRFLDIFLIHLYFLLPHRLFQSLVWFLL